MEEYEITILNRRMEVAEYVSGNNLLDALGDFYSRFGYQTIINIKLI